MAGGATTRTSGDARLLERYQNLVTHSREAIFCIEFEPPIALDLPEMDQVDRIYRCGRVVEANDAFAAAYGTTLETTIGWTLEDFLPRALPTTIPFVREAVRARYRMSDVETVERAQDGSEKIFLSNFTGVIENGRVLRVWGTTRDITHRRQAEREIQLLRDELAYVGRQASLGELTAAIAHELNQPLTAIASNARAAQRFLAAPDPDLEEIREILDDVVDANRRAADVIRKLRAMLKKREPDFEPLDLNQTIREVMLLLHSDAVIKNVDVALELAEDLPPVQGDRIQLQQLLLNLVLNGFDAMADLPAAERRLVIRTGLIDDGTVAVSVRDVGIGFEGHETNELFAPFATTKAEGMGMGLAIASSIVDAHGGRIAARENAETGATFEVALPAMEDDG